MLIPKKHIALFVFLFFASICQIANAQTQFAYRVSFADKVGTKGTIGAPSDYLSERAMERRTRFQIAIDSNDLPVSQNYIDSILQKTSGKIHTQSRWQNNCVVLVNDTSTMASVRVFNFVKSAELVAIFLSPLHFIATQKDNEKPKVNRQFAKGTSGGIGYYGDAYDQISLAKGDTLHQLGYRGKGKLIAVIDEGFLYVNTLPGFDSLMTSGRIKDTYNFVQNNGSVYQNSAHGTQVLSTMAGIIKDAYVGTAPDADYALYISEHSGGEQPFEMDNLVAAMERADSVGADVITISLGYNSFDIGGKNASLSIADIDGKSTVAARAANVATQKGILVVASAGNDGGTTWSKVLTPGDADSALTCGSVNSNKVLAGTSGRGPNSAGVLKPDVCMLGAPGFVFNNSGTVSAVGGTSIATPELAGLAACLMQAFPKRTPYYIKKAIKDSAHIAANPNNDLGYGVPNFAKSYLSLSPEVVCICAAGVNIYPNPFTNKIIVDISGYANHNINWSLKSIEGKEIANNSLYNQSSSLTFELNVPENLPRGIYFLHLTTADGTKVIKLQK